VTRQKFPNIAKDRNLQIYEAQKTISGMNMKKMFSNVTVKLLKIKGKEKILKAAREK
jgi:hypothetical protein